MTKGIIPVSEDYDSFEVIENVYLNDTVLLMNEMVVEFQSDILIAGIDDLYEFYNFVKNLRYIDYADNEVVKRPIYTMTEGGDCDQKTILIACFIREFMPYVKQFYKVIIPEGEENFSHIYNIIYFNGSMWPIDSTYSFCEIFKEFPYTDFLLYGVVK